MLRYPEMLHSRRARAEVGRLAAADRAVTIPTWSTTSSLNLAIATAILVYEARRQGVMSG